MSIRVAKELSERQFIFNGDHHSLIVVGYVPANRWQVVQIPVDMLHLMSGDILTPH